MNYRFIALFLIIAGLTPFYADAQCSSLANKALPMLKPFNSSGQYNHALLSEGETAEFQVMFYAGSKYRIVASTGPNSDTLAFNVLDEKYNLIYSNEDYNYVQSVDFAFNATAQYIIQATLREGAGSGCAVILVGFEE